MVGLPNICPDGRHTSDVAMKRQPLATDSCIVKNEWTAVTRAHRHDAGDEGRGARGEGRGARGDVRDEHIASTSTGRVRMLRL